MTRLAVLSVLLLLAGCTALPPLSCPNGTAAANQAELYFGRAAPDGTVSDPQWQRFVDTEITPRFPKGFAVEDAAGQWQGREGIVREPAKHLIVVLGSSGDADKLDAIRAAYKQRFRQDSVLLVLHPVCVSF
jgi:hypothetical protein